jgi:hypothetical protein
MEFRSELRDLARSGAGRVQKLRYALRQLRIGPADALGAAISTAQEQRRRSQRGRNSSHSNTTVYQFRREFSLTEGSAPGTRGYPEAVFRYRRRFVAGRGNGGDVSRSHVEVVGDLVIPRF